MIGKIYGVGGGTKKITVTFNLTPKEAKLTLKDRDKKEIPYNDSNTYKIEPGLYYYDCTSENYTSIQDKQIILLQDETIDITLQFEVYRSKEKYSKFRNNLGKNRSK